VKAALIVAGVIVLAIIGAFFVSTSLGVAAIIGGVFFMLVFGLALARGSNDSDDELYDDE
jgi:membrane protein CcdC involved in cytochrome C biogenesis